MHACSFWLSGKGLFEIRLEETSRILAESMAAARGWFNPLHQVYILAALARVRQAQGDALSALAASSRRPGWRRQATHCLVQMTTWQPLSEREREVLRLVAAGHSNAEIARDLIVELSTVKTHLTNLDSKLGVHTRTQALGRARELGLLE